jgi:hypothetical protein
VVLSSKGRKLCFPNQASSWPWTPWVPLESRGVYACVSPHSHTHTHTPLEQAPGHCEQLHLPKERAGGGRLWTLVLPSLPVSVMHSNTRPSIGFQGAHG